MNIRRLTGMRAIGAILCMCLFLTGCWDRTELNQLAITSAAALDYKDGQWVVTYQVVIPSAISAAMTAVDGGAAKLPVIVYSTKGKTIREAVGRSSLENPRRLLFSHTRVMIVSSAAIKQGLSPILDVYLRNADTRETVSILIVDGDARKILEQLMQIQIIPGDGIEEMMLREAKDISFFPSVKVFKLVMELIGPAKSAVIPEIVISGSPGVTTADELNRTALSSKLRLGRLAVIRENKLVGWLSREESLGVSFLRNEVRETTLSFRCGSASKDVDSSFRLSHSNTRITPRKYGEQWMMEVEIDGEGMLLETSCRLDLSKTETVEMLQAQLSKEVEGAITQSWLAVKKLKTDVVGFADRVYRKHPKEWKKIEKNWTQTFEKIDIRLKTRITIARMGLSTRSFKLETEDVKE